MPVRMLRLLQHCCSTLTLVIGAFLHRQAAPRAQKCVHQWQKVAAQAASQNGQSDAHEHPNAARPYMALQRPGRSDEQITQCREQKPHRDHALGLETNWAPQDMLPCGKHVLPKDWCGGYIACVHLDAAKQITPGVQNFFWTIADMVLTNANIVGCLVVHAYRNEAGSLCQSCVLQLG